MPANRRDEDGPGAAGHLPGRRRGPEQQEAHITLGRQEEEIRQGN